MKHTKKLLSIFFSLCMLLSITAGLDFSAYAITSGDYEYSVLSETDKTCEITKYNGSASNLNIPLQLNDYTVISVGINAFNFSSIKSITLPSSIESIEKNAFSCCIALSNITLPNGLKTIGNGAFDSCESLTDVIIPYSVTSIGYGAFYNCNDLKITIKNPKCEIYDSSYTISQFATIYGCKNSTAENYANKYERNFVLIENQKQLECDLFLHLYLDSISSDGVSKTEAQCISDSGFAVYPDKTTRVKYQTVVGAQNYPDTDVIVEEISYYYNPIFTVTTDDDLEIEQAETVIINGVIFNHLIVKNVVLPRSDLRKEFYLYFTAPSGYTDVFSELYCEIKSGVSDYIDPDSIPGNALVSGTFNLNEDDADAYLNENDLVAWPYGLKYEINNASVKITGYIENDNVNMLYIPSDIDGNPVTDIGDSAFMDSTTSLNTVFIPSSVKNILGHAFGNYSDGKIPSMKNVIISEGISWIGGGAFYNCTNLEYINLPSTVSNIRPMIINGEYYYYGSFLSYGLYLYKETPNPSIKDISVIEDSYAEKYLRDIKYNEIATFSDLISRGKKIYTVHYDVSTNGGDWNATETRPASTGDDIDLTLKANKNGYQFIGWNTNPSATKGLSSIKMGDSDIVLYAIFEKTLSSVSIATQPAKGIYYIGDSLDTSGLQLKLTYSDGLTKTVSSGYTVSGFNSSDIGTKIVTVNYEGLTTSFIVKIECAHKVTTSYPAKVSTCNTHGNSEYVICNDCGIIVSGSNTELSYTEHNYETTTTKATTSKNGSTVTKCTVCGNVKSSATIYYPKSISLSKTSFTYNGKVQQPTVTVKDSNGTVLKNKTDYKITYQNSINPGTYTVKIEFIGNYSGTKNLTYTIIPRNTAISSVSGVVNGFTVKWSKVSDTTGYQIQYSTRSDFKNAATVYGGATNTTSKTITGRAGGTKYYVRVRTYKNINGTYVWGNWTSAKTVTTKVATATAKSVSGVSKGFKVTWDKIGGITGYQVQYSTRSDFKNAATVYAGNSAATSKTITGRARNTKYYVRVRAYKNNNGSYVYGAWSSAKNVKTK